MYTVAKILFDHKMYLLGQGFRESKRFNTKEGNLKIKFHEFNYHDKSKKILQAFGIVHHPEFGRIRVTWNYEGKAFIANENFPRIRYPGKRISQSSFQIDNQREDPRKRRGLLVTHDLIT